MRNPAKPFDYQDATARLRAKLAPFDRRLQGIQDSFNAWFQREANRPGATITGGAPEEVDAAIQRVNHEKAKAARAFGESVAADIAADDAADVAAIREAYATLVDLIERRRERERERARFLGACGRQIGLSLTDSAITPNNFHEWNARVDAVLNPPRRGPVMRAIDNPLVLQHSDVAS